MFVLKKFKKQLKILKLFQDELKKVFIGTVSAKTSNYAELLR